MAKKLSRKQQVRQWMIANRATADSWQVLGNSAAHRFDLYDHIGMLGWVHPMAYEVWTTGK